MKKLPLIGLCLLAAHCTEHAEQTDAAVADAGADASVARPNIVFILTDDLSWNLVQYLPHVVQMQKQGTTFSHYFVTDSLCCPSRSSIFTGKYPHNTGVFTNGGDAGGYHEFEKRGNAPQSFAATLQAAGYKAGMMGKYLNGYVPRTDSSDPGWSGWDVAGEGGYGEYHYELNENGTVHFYGDGGANYLTDVLSGLAVQFLGAAGSGPYMLEVATFAPHAPYTPAPRNIGQFNVTLPRTGAFNVLNVNPPLWLAQHPALTPAQIATLDQGYNLRVEAVQAVDDLIATVMSKIDSNTWLIFSSDNGYHMGEHMLLAGKQTAFDHDINVPLIVVGPGVPKGAVVDNFVENIDLCPTFADLAGAAPPATADGRSLVPLMLGQAPSDWRNVVLIEHHGPDLEKMDPGDPDAEDATTQPNSYEAIRMANSVYVEYQDGEKEFYDLMTDPYELTNTAASLSPAQTQSYHQSIVAIKTCQGAAACWAAQKR
jgi:arylsulfatase A-like enzyme